MLSIKAGAVIYSRLQVLCDNNICPENIAGLTDKQIKSIGTSNSKVSYIKGVTEAVLNENLVLSDLQNLSDDEVIKKTDFITWYRFMDSKNVSHFCFE